MQTEILARVADYIRNPEVRKKVEQGQDVSVKDRVEISDTAKKKQETMNSVQSSYEKAHLERFDSVARRVKSDEYTLNAEMIDDIAQKIVKLL